jgi:hypothetical protein
VTSRLTRDELRDHLIRTRIAGDVATSRENNLDHYRSLALRDPHYMFGLTFEGDWAYRDVLALMSKSAGVVADPGRREGQDTIDPDRTIDALDAMADRIAATLRTGSPLIAVCVPLDDNVLPRYYGPLTVYLVDRITQGL